MVDTLDVNAMNGCHVYVLVEELLKIGQTERVVVMGREDGNIAIYNLNDGQLTYHGYIDIENEVMIEDE